VGSLAADTSLLTCQPARTTLVGSLSTTFADSRSVRRASSIASASLRGRALANFNPSKAASSTSARHSRYAASGRRRAPLRRRQIGAVDPRPKRATRSAECGSVELAVSHTREEGPPLVLRVPQWRTIRGVERKTDEVLWKRFSMARESFNRRRGSHFAELDRQRAAARARNEKLTLEAEKLVDPTTGAPPRPAPGIQSIAAARDWQRTHAPRSLALALASLRVWWAPCVR